MDTINLEPGGEIKEALPVAVWQGIILKHCFYGGLRPNSNDSRLIRNLDRKYVNDGQYRLSGLSWVDLD